MQRCGGMGAHTMLEARGEAITLEVFNSSFQGKFFPPHVRAAREREFLSLVQGNSSVYEYAIQFERLYQFYSHPTSEEWRCQRFSGWLRTDIKKTLIPLRITKFADLVDQATIIESFNLEDVGGAGKAQFSRQASSYGGNMGATKGSYSRPYRQQQFRPSQSKGATSSAPRPVGTATSAFQPRGACAPYFRAPAPTTSGHLVKDCLTSRSGAASLTASALHAVRPRVVRALPVTRPKAEARVFTTSGTEAAQAMDLVQGTEVVVGTSLSVLFDSRVMHSFIVDTCLKDLKLPVSDLKCDLVVTTPTLNSLTTSIVCIECPIIVEGQEYRVNLISIPMSGLDIILGMDWLTANHERQLIPVVRDFFEIFPDDILGIPPPREIKFGIDIVPGAEPVSIAPYWMALRELMELKNQIEDLM
ncbi:uncharacterized protein LOC113859524 [Abrus precatorius]|uniref:Uncharacterized protein LOC113859524 n=1 Tax=Abrus precatorius TaxID=3816 RepID=A0A8B8L0B3_ABRPR|nr:uncharacterized protein LOC113859524 [Abrus precatorius]